MYRSAHQPNPCLHKYEPSNPRHRDNCIILEALFAVYYAREVVVPISMTTNPEYNRPQAQREHIEPKKSAKYFRGS